MNIKPALSYKKINKGTYLFRAAPNICNYETTHGALQNALVCSDTGKKGIYFATLPIIALAMCIEYKRLMQIGVFELTEDIYIAEDKYSFRNINPTKYYDNTGKLKLGINPLQEENISHIQCNLNLLLDLKTSLLPDKLQQIINPDSCEIFLTELHIPKVKFLIRFIFHPTISDYTKLLKYIKENNYPLYLGDYVKDNILMPLQCFT